MSRLRERGAAAYGSSRAMLVATFPTGVGCFTPNFSLRAASLLCAPALTKPGTVISAGVADVWEVSLLRNPPDNMGALLLAWIGLLGLELATRADFYTFRC